MVALSAAVTAWAVPAALEPRIRLNEEAAVALLRFQAAAETTWRAEHGEWAEFSDLLQSSQALPIPRGPRLHLKRPLLPSGFYPDRTGVVLRSGYYFQQAYDRDGSLVGCWAWPKLEWYSGNAVYWLDYAAGQVFELSAGQPESRLPPAASLERKPVP